MVHQIADEIEELARTKNVAVMARGEHLCMSMRGVKTPTMMTPSVLRGVFRYSSGARSEFLTVVFDGAGRGARVRRLSNMAPFS